MSTTCSTTFINKSCRQLCFNLQSHFNPFNLTYNEEDCVNFKSQDYCRVTNAHSQEIEEEEEEQGVVHIRRLVKYACMNILFDEDEITLIFSKTSVKF